MFWRKKSIQWIARTLLFTVLYCFCGGAEAADYVYDTMQKRTAAKRFAENLGIDPERILDPETPDERAERIAQDRKDTIARLKSQICSTASEEEIAEIQAEHTRLKNEYLPERVTGLAQSIVSLDERLEKETLQAKQGKPLTFTGVDVLVYHEAMARGYEDLDKLIQVTSVELKKAKMPQEIIDRTLRVQNLLKKETGSLRVALSTNLVANRDARRLPLSINTVSRLQSQVRQTVTTMREATQEATGRSDSETPSETEEDGTPILPPVGGGSSSGGGSGVGGGGGDDGQSGMRAKLTAVFRNAGHSGGDSSSGTGGDPVDLGTGVFMRDDIDFTIASTGDVAGVRRRYRSDNPINGIFGKRWNHGYGIFLTIAGNGDVTLVNDDGRGYFYPKEDETTFGPTEELDGELKIVENQYRLETGGFVFLFDDTGKLLSRCDSSDNCMVMIYDEGKLVRVNDGDGGPLIEYTYNVAGYVESASGRGDRMQTYTYDSEGNLLTSTNADGEQYLYSYYSNNILAAVTDPEGQSVQVFYDSEGRVHRQIDPEGNEETFSYDFINHTTVVTDGNGNTRSVVHDPDGHVVEAVDALGNRIFKTYDERGRLTSITDEFGRITTYEYADTCDNCGVTKVTEPDGTITTSGYGEYGRIYNRIDRSAYNSGVASATYVYDASGNLYQIEFTSVLPEYGSGKLRGLRQIDEDPITYEYDDKGQVVRATSPDGLDTVYEYDEKTGTQKAQKFNTEDADGNPVQLASHTMKLDDAGLPTGYIDGAGKEYTTVTNARGMPTQLIPPEADSVPIEVSYDRNGFIQAVTRSQTIVTEYAFDGNGRNTLIDSPQSGREEKVYDGVGNVLEIIDGNGNKIQYTYNSINQQIYSLDPRGNPTDYLYCGNGDQPNGLVNPTGDGMLMEYDSKDRLTKTVDDLGNSTVFEYNSSSNKPTLVRDAEGNETQHIFDGQGRLLEVIDALGNSTSYEYGPNSPDPTKITDAENHIWQYAYDGLGRLIRETDPLNRVTKHYYDGAGNETRIVDPDGRETTYSYDDWNRKVAATYPDSSTASWKYENDLLVEESTSNRTKQYEFNSDGRISKVIDVDMGENLRYTYTATGQVKTIQDDQGNITTYTYNESDDLVAIDYPGNKRLSYGYDEAGRRNRIWYPNGIRCEIDYDSVGRKSSIIYYSPDEQPFEGQSFNYDKVGNITRETDHNGNITAYTYDDLYRIKEVRENGTLVESFTYDKVGNVKTIERPQQSETINYAYDAANQLESQTTTAGQTTYLFDGAGRLTQKSGPDGTFTYHYTAKDRLARVDLPGGQSVEYEYDADGRLVARTKGTDEEEYLIDREHVYADYSGGQQAQLYHRGPETDEIAGSTPQGEETQYYHQNHLQSIKVATGRFGDVEGQREYWAYGETRSDTGTPGVNTRFGYAGREFDSDTGLIYNRARWYMPEAGRFLTLDEKRGQFDQPTSLHRYLYSMANPINYNDPTGFGVGSVVRTAFMDYLGIQKNIILGLAKQFVSCYSPLAALIVSFYDVYYAMLASLMDILFTYGNMPGTDCAMQLLMIVHFICQILNIIAAATWTSCMSKIWETLAKALISEAIKAISSYIAKLITDALKTGKAVNAALKFMLDYMMVALDIYLGLCSGVGIALGVIKLFLAPELCIGFCLMYIFLKKGS